MKSILIIGLGRFGRHMAKKFLEQGNEVLGVDMDEERVNDALDVLTSAQIGDAKTERFVEHLGVRNFDLCVVAIGDDFQGSLETTSLLKEYGAKFVLARASRDVHAKFLLRNGADRIVYAEREMAERLAVTYGSDNIFDYVELTDEYSIYEIKIPESWIGHSIIKLNVRSKYGINVLAIKNEGVIDPAPCPEHIFSDKETMIVMSHNDDVEKITHLK